MSISLSFLITMPIFAQDIAIISPADKVIADFITEKQTLNTSMQNIQALQQGKVDFAIVNSNHVYDVQQSTPTLKSVVALYPKVLAFITKKESNITSLLDLKDKKFRACFTCKGTQSFCNKIFSACDIKQSYKQIPFDEAKKQLKSGEIDGLFSLVGHPNEDIRKLNKELNITFIPLVGKKLDQLNRDYPYFVKSGMPKGIYPNLNKDIKSIGVKALLLTREDINESCVHDLTQTILNNMKTIKETNFIYREISKKTLLEGLVLPQHKGAAKAFNGL